MDLMSRARDRRCGSWALDWLASGLRIVSDCRGIGVAAWAHGRPRPCRWRRTKRADDRRAWSPCGVLLPLRQVTKVPVESTFLR